MSPTRAYVTSSTANPAASSQRKEEGKEDYRCFGGDEEKVRGSTYSCDILSVFTSLRVLSVAQRKQGRKSKPPLAKHCATQ